MRIGQLAALLEFLQQTQIGACSALFDVEPLACVLQPGQVVAGGFASSEKDSGPWEFRRQFESASDW